MTDVAFNVTRRCNKRCSYCYLNLNNVDLPFSTFREIVENVEIRSLTLTGGEAFLHPKIFQMISLGRRNAEKIDLLTNGVLLTSNNIKKLSELTPTTLYVTYNEIDLELSQKIKKASRYGLEINIYHLLRKQSLNHLQNICEQVSFAKRILFLYPTDIGKHNVQMYFPHEWEYLMAKALEIATNYDFTVFFEQAFIKKDSVISKTMMCPTGEDLYIDVNGLNYACCLLVDRVVGQRELMPIKLDQHSCPFLMENKLAETSEYQRICPLLLTSQNDVRYVFPSHLDE